MSINTYEINETIKLNKKVIIGDPCYKVDSMETVKNVLPGIYHAFLRIADCNSWGKRISRLMVIHKDYLSKIDYDNSDSYALENNMNGLYTENTNYIGVDSGQAGIYDYAYFHKYENEREYGKPADWYTRVCNMTETPERGGVLDSRCAVSSSGYGDGSYPCTIFRDKHSKEAVAFSIDFEVEYNADEDDEDEYISCGECIYWEENEEGIYVCKCPMGTIHYGEEVSFSDGCEHGER